ncbi:MAG: hypothetical protein AAGF79_21065 [Pseudomonadota bacterium]
MFSLTAFASDAPATEVQFPASCAADSTAAFNEGLSLLHNMMYIQAEDAFNRAALADPDCAMPHWGIAMSNFHPLWPGTPSDAEMVRGQTAASVLAGLTPGSGLEAAMVAAAVAFYAERPEGYRARLAAWAQAQIEAAAMYPENIDAAALAALAQLAVAPRGPDGAKVKAGVGDRLDALHARAPDHPGVIHYAIHAYDNPPLKERGTPYAQIYDKTAPNAPHALHMPAHIFTRTGEWEASIDLNRRSAEAALDQSTDVIQTHYAHAIDYMVYGLLQVGDYPRAEQMVNEMLAIDNHQVSFGGAYALAAAPVRLVLEREDWAGAAALSPDMHPAIPWESFPQTVAMRWFAKGLGAARSGDLVTARAAIDALTALHADIEARGAGYWAKLTEGQMETIAAWIALSEGDADTALANQTAAADLEDALGKSPVTPGHVLPARELLGDMLAQLGRTEEAKDAYRTTLSLSPNRGRSTNALK